MDKRNDDFESVGGKRALLIDQLRILQGQGLMRKNHYF